MEDITAAAGVSQRTFFRYFAAKEDVALAWLDDTGPLIRDSLRRQPAELSIFLALRGAFVEMAQSGSDLTRHGILIQRLSQESSKLRAGLLVRQQVWTEELSVVVAERLQKDPSELEPRLWAAVAMTIATSSGEWGVANGVEDVPALMLRGFDVAAAMAQ